MWGCGRSVGGSVEGGGGEAGDPEGEGQDLGGVAFGRTQVSFSQVSVLDMSADLFSGERSPADEGGGGVGEVGNETRRVSVRLSLSNAVPYHAL